MGSGLDLDTSGLLVIALRRKAERALMEQFRQRRIEKQYIAVLEGRLSSSEGLIDVPLRRCQGLPPRSVVDEEKGKPAQTEFRVLEVENERTRVLLFPKTGRSHQLRVHMAHIGHPIVGDRFYHPQPHGRMLLHAQEIAFAHPYHEKECRFVWEAPF